MTLLNKFQSIKNIIMPSFPYGQEFNYEYYCECELHFKDKTFIDYNDFQKHLSKTRHLLQSETKIHTKKFYYSNTLSKDSIWYLFFGIILSLIFTIIITQIIKFILPNDLILYLTIYPRGTESTPYYWFLILPFLLGIFLTFVVFRLINQYSIKNNNFSKYTIKIYPISKKESIEIVSLAIIILLMILLAISQLIQLLLISPVIITDNKYQQYFGILFTILFFSLITIFALKDYNSPKQKLKPNPEFNKENTYGYNVKEYLPDKKIN